MTREEFIKQRCEIDKITEEEFERTYRVVECNCGKIYCNGYRCLDLDGLLKENQELKKQLENKNPLGGIFVQVNDDMLLRNCGAMQSEINEYKTQQKEFIKWLEKKQSFLRDEISELTLGMCNTDFQDMKIEVYEKVLQKYKRIIGNIYENEVN